jgi:hypothetical protein
MKAVSALRPLPSVPRHVRSINAGAFAHPEKPVGAVKRLPKIAGCLKTATSSPQHLPPQFAQSTISRKLRSVSTRSTTATCVRSSKVAVRSACSTTHSTPLPRYLTSGVNCYSDTRQAQLPADILQSTVAKSTIVKMGYEDIDWLAINTIRLLAVIYRGPVYCCCLEAM